MIEFFAKTWFLWWIIAGLAIVRWFHLASLGGSELELEDADAGHQDIGGSSCELNSIRL
jgi:hypothetical protein